MSLYKICKRWSVIPSYSACMICCSKSFVTSNTSSNDEYTHFGFESVKKDEKSKKVHNVFSTVASKYDLMNDIMSFGIHRLWKDKLIQILNPSSSTILLDCAGGTGDIAFRCMNYVKATSTKKHPKVTVCDINESMLNVGKARAKDLNLEVDWVCGNADKLPFPCDTFNAYTIAFGIRNCTDINNVLQEAYRVLMPGGRFLCLEFSEVNNVILKRLYDSYSFQVIPVMGEVVAGDWKSYQYLSESIRRFPNQEDFKKMIKNNGFHQVTYMNLSFGICAIHSGFKL